MRHSWHTLGAQNMGSKWEWKAKPRARKPSPLAHLAFPRQTLRPSMHPQQPRLGDKGPSPGSEGVLGSIMTLGSCSSREPKDSPGS